jgi:hypothetical protein
MAELSDFIPSKGIKVAEDPISFQRGVGTKVQAAFPAFVRTAALTAAQAVVFTRSKVRKEKTDIESYLGTPVFAQVQIQGGSFFELEDTTGENPIEFEGIVMQTVLVDVSMSKNIVKTSIQGRDGTVKEYISKGDYIINMTGNIVGQTKGNTIEGIGQVFPKIDTEKLIKICEVPEAITITSEFLQLFGINEVVIEDYKFAEKEGFRNMQPFQISMSSDTPINLEEL